MSRRKFAERVATVSSEPFRLALGLPPDVIRLSVGEPDFATPSFVSEAAKRAIDEGFTHYSPEAGYDDLRRAVADKLRRENHVSYDYESEVLITPGSSAGIHLVLQALLDPGDEVLVPDPGWFHYSTLVSLCGATSVGLPIRVERENSIDIDEVKKLITEKTRILILNSPSNPTGLVHSADVLSSLGEIAEKYDLIILSDEIYERIVYPGNQQISPASIGGLKGRTITSNGFSKAYAMTGWRVGYLAAPQEIVDRVTGLSGYTLVCASSVSQRAAYAALTDPRMHEIVNQMVSQFGKRRSIVIDALEKLEAISLFPPQGAFYAWVDIQKTQLSSEGFAHKLVTEKKVGVMPGNYFGLNGRGHIRISFATQEDQLKEGLKRFREFVEKR